MRVHHVHQLCCLRFTEAVDRGEIVHSEADDETEWFINTFWHICFCPFFGVLVMGKGWGKVEPGRGKQTGSVA